MTDALPRIFEASHRVDPSLLRRLGSQDIERLKGMALGQVPSPDRARALEAWFELGRADAPEVLEAVLARRQDDRALRAAAAAYLGRLGGPTSEAILLGALKGEEDPVVVAKVLAAIGRVGTPDALAALEERVRSTDVGVSRQAHLAFRLVVHRHGLAGRDLAAAVRRMPSVGAMRPFAFLPASSEAAQEALVSLRGDTFGIALVPATAHEIRCADRRLLVMLGAKSPGAILEEALRRPTLAGVVALRSPEDGSYSVARLLLAGPREGTVHVDVYRTDGKLVHVGTAKRGDDRWTIDIGSADVPGSFAVEIGLDVHAAELTVTRAVSGGWTAGRGRPTPRKPPTRTG